MKKLFALFLSFLPFLATAYDFSAKNKDGVEIYYKLLSRTECEVTYKEKIDIGRTWENNTSYQGVVKIPSTVHYLDTDFNVVGIGEDAFRQCKLLTYLSIPSSIKKIGVAAFAHCDGLKSVEFSSIKQICSMQYEQLFGEVIFSNPLTIAEHLFINGKEITELVFPEDVSYIPNRGFENLKELKSVVISDAIESIGKNAFSGCKSLESIVVGRNVKDIGYLAFPDHLKEIIILNEDPPQNWDNIFMRKEFITETKLIVPKGTKEKYSEATFWKRFWSIEERNLNIVKTGNAVIIADSEYMVSGAIEEDIDEDFNAQEYGFYYGTEMPDLKKIRVSDIKNGEFKALLTNLSPSAKYYYRAYAANSTEVFPGAIKTFIAFPDEVPSVKTNRVTEISATSAIFHANIGNLGNISSITEYGFFYGTTEDPQTPIKLTKPIEKGDFYAKTEEPLQENTTYYYRAYAKNNKGISYGDVFSFKTDLSLPVVTLLSSSRSNKPNSFKVTGKILSGINISKYGFCVGTSDGSEAFFDAYSLLKDGTFSRIIENFQLNKDYYIKAYAENPKGKVRGEAQVIRINEPSKFENFTCALKSIRAKNGSAFSMKASAEIIAESEIVYAGFLVAEYKLASSARYNIGSVSEAERYLNITDIEDCFNGQNHVCEVKKNSISAKIKPLTGSSSSPLYFVRPYMLLANGNVVYGDVEKCILP